MHAEAALEVFYRKAVLKNFAVLRFIFNKVAGLQASNFIKKRLQHRFFFSMNIAQFFRKPILKNICEWQLLFMVIFLHFSRKLAILSRRNQLF